MPGLVIALALLPVARRPFAEHDVELLAAAGVDDLVVSIAYRGELLRSPLRDGCRWAGRMLSDAGRWRMRERIEARVRRHKEQ